MDNSAHSTGWSCLSPPPESAVRYSRLWQSRVALALLSDESISVSDPVSCGHV
ncbi:hypothetical protein ABZP36_012979 [Zizania latifolia]